MLLGVPCRGVGCRGWTPSTPKTRIGVGSEAGVQAEGAVLLTLCRWCVAGTHAEEGTGGGDCIDCEAGESSCKRNPKPETLNPQPEALAVCPSS